MQKILTFTNWLKPDISERAKEANVLYDLVSDLEYKNAKIVSISQQTQVVDNKVCLITTVLYELPDK